MAGLAVKYDCPHCRTRLTSSIMEAGDEAPCPECHGLLQVPGEKEKMDEVGRQLGEQQRREQRGAMKKEAASQVLTQRLAAEAQRDRNLALDRDPLREWIIYAAVIGILIVAAAGIHMVRAVVTDGSGLVLLIMGLFGLGVVLNFRAVKGLRNEFVCAAFLLKKLKTAGGLNEIVAVSPSGVFHRHIQDLVKIAKHDPNVSQDSLVTLLYSRMMARAKIVEVLSGVLVSLGLIGTVVGLITMTSGLGVTLESLGETSDPGDLMTGLRSTMAGLGTAFYTTLVGAILGSVVLRVLNNVYTSNVDHFVSYIASLTEVQITPRLRKNSRAGKPVEVTA
ncbi:MotA/TolQ/ExbB proton channel family protein [Candidatus Laterigemmans baculatus]|uniref:MotA/TolQ/ExbB proton channel family protein n=1 Tax=Candidatus Laterigemmans baculatus TaxID=2770505 RepID=UPI0013DA7DE4|nr:MotA/TolQ/ExbB proton channel family protein [Candidatus Laterigemmans baculatus]